MMNKAVTKTETQNSTPLTGLDLLRKPFEPHQISKLPKPTKRQTEEVKADFKKGIRCQECGAWHHPDVVHLDYVGHAALTDRLLDCDPEWNWEPVAVGEHGEPALDRNGGLWIKLTVCGVTRLGYGHADGKQGGDAVKETIGDALRNAAMRFGAALDLWHKGVLHADAEDEPATNPAEPPAKSQPKADARPIYTQAVHDIKTAPTPAKLKSVWEAIAWAEIPEDWKPALVDEKNTRLAQLKTPEVKPASESLDEQFPGELEPDDTGYTAADYMRAG